VDTTAVLGNAITDYLLAVAAKTAPAARAPEHMAEWLDAHGYRIVHVPATIEPGDPGVTDISDRIAALIDRRSCCRDGADRCSILRQVRAAGQPVPTYAGWRAFSNGANMASALLLRRPGTLAGAVLLAAMVPFQHPPAANLSGKRVVVAYGRRDPMATPAHTQTLADHLRARGAAVTVLSHPGGHAIDPHQLPTLAAFRAEGARHG
jgi:dienelactone hydrolase